MTRQPSASDVPISQIWREHHGYLINVAYRMLASFSDAEDMVQEAFARLLRADHEKIDDVRGWLVVVVSRLCLDQLRSARVRRETYVGPWLPEPVIPSGDALGPEERVVLDDSVRMALLVVLERLSPAERVAFILHDIFEYSFEDIGRIMQRTPVACRQLASRGRRQVLEEGAGMRGRVDPWSHGASPSGSSRPRPAGISKLCLRSSTPRQRGGRTPAACCLARAIRWWAARRWRSACWDGCGAAERHSSRCPSTRSRRRSSSSRAR